MEHNLSHDMPTKSVSILLSESAERQLRQRAGAEGMPLEEFARLVLERETALSAEAQSPEAWVSEWRAWASSRQRQELSLDDSRESIYE